VSIDDWRNDGNRGPWVRNSLKHRADEMRTMAAKCRRAFLKPWYGELANYLADAYEEAANVFQRKLDECQRTDAPTAAVDPIVAQAEVDERTPRIRAAQISGGSAGRAGRASRAPLDDEPPTPRAERRRMERRR
jgi:hypothetical protein